MAECTKVSGLIIIWMAWVSKHGQMDVGIKESIKMIKRMGLDTTHGLINATTVVIGLEENSMALAFTHQLDQSLVTACGKKVKESNGTTLLRLNRLSKAH